jgi:hypothetical protein
MGEKIALNRVPGVSEVGHQRDDAGLVQIEPAIKDPRRINGMIQLGALAP